MKTHELNICPEYFEQMKNGTKTFEMRFNDRDYQVGDHLLLTEWDPINTSAIGDTLKFKVTSILYGPLFGLLDKYCIMSTQLL